MTIAQVTRIDDETYERLALADDDHKWELHDGRVVEKPGMSTEHNDAMILFVLQIGPQLDRSQFRLRSNSSRLRYPASYYIPDLVVVPTEYERPKRGQPGKLETYDQPLPLVVEIWSPSTGRYDVGAKVPLYQTRGDQEIWFLHPFERTLRVWRRQADGTYAVFDYRGGTVPVESLPGVTIDLGALFEP